VEIFPGAYASSPASGLVGNINYGLVPLNADGSIDVNIKSSSAPMEVDIDAVNGLAFSLCTVPGKIK
jgi:hypothetical protein